MAMTARVKDELSRLDLTKPCCRKSEVAATLRFAGGLHIVGGRIVVEAELDTANAARRLRKNIGDLRGKRIVIVGDVQHSRVARTDLWGLTKMGAGVVV